jgi:hypothetical protein
MIDPISTELSVAELFSQPVFNGKRKEYIPDDVSDIVCFPPGKYFIGDPCYAVPNELWFDFIKASEGEAIDLEGVGRGVYYSHQYVSDDEGFSYPSDSGTIGIVCVDNFSIGHWARLREMGRLVEFTDGDPIAKDEDGDELYGDWEEAFQVYNDRQGNIFLGWNWFLVDDEANEDDNGDDMAGDDQVEDGELIMSFSIEMPDGLDVNASLIYMWEIRTQDGSALLGRYVGKSSKGDRRPRIDYSRNVSNLLAGKPYRKDNHDGFRRIHEALAGAVKRGDAITLFFLSNIGPNEDINVIERKYISEMNSSGLESWQLND